MPMFLLQAFAACSTLIRPTSDLHGPAFLPRKMLQGHA
jgi:hypothetical protein